MKTAQKKTAQKKITQKKTAQKNTVAKKASRQGGLDGDKLIELLQKILREVQEINEHLQDMEDNRTLPGYEEDDDADEEAEDEEETRPR